MMPVLIGVSQRVTFVEEYGERRDALDQRWSEFLFSCGLVPILIPNHIAVARQILNAIKLNGILLTGGNSLVSLGGDAPERDATEVMLLQFARDNRLPLIGVCRGMQVLQHATGVPLEPVEGHVSVPHWIEEASGGRTVNSFHHFGTKACHSEWIVTAKASDGVVEAIEHIEGSLEGIMWHPERCDPILDSDRERFRKFFGISSH